MDRFGTSKGILLDSNSSGTAFVCKNEPSAADLARLRLELNDKEREQVIIALNAWESVFDPSPVTGPAGP